MPDTARYCYAYPHPAVTTDVVLFRIHEGEPQILLIQRAGEPYRGMWALPGGFLEIDEELERCARRELEEETGISDVTLEQFHTFGAVQRDPRERVISVAYYGVLQSPHGSPRAASDASAACWFPLAKLPQLAFDHAQVIALARQRLPAARRDSDGSV